MSLLFAMIVSALIVTAAIIPAEPEVTWIGHPMFVMAEDLDNKYAVPYVMSDLICGVAESNQVNGDWEFVMVCKDVSGQ